MCGIYGLIERGAQCIDAKLEDMSLVTRHRGPDDANWTSFYSGKSVVGYGINRLSIIDVAGGQQPISNEDGQLDVVFNGEIYNYRELRGQLEKKGHVFRTKSDTEVIVHLYEDVGHECVHQLRGMFAFSVFDKRNRTLFLARDHLGIKPLYYSHTDGRLVFGSEIKALMKVLGKTPVSPKAALDYFTFRYILSPNTIYEGVMSLPAGHCATYNLGSDRLNVRLYWTPPRRKVRDDYGTAKAKVQELLTESVRLRLQSEVPLGSFLSGGVDSSLLATIVAKELGHDINVYNIGYSTANEYEYAEMVSRELGFNYYQTEITDRDMVGILDDVLHHMDQPLSDAACFPTLFLSRVVKRAVTVMLSGEGADELFAGYWQYDQMLASGENTLGSFLTRSSYFQDQKGAISRAFDHDLYRESLWTGKSTLDKMSRYDISTWLPDDLLMKIDKMTMAASVEARVPFLDVNLVEYVMSLPDHYKYRNGTTKRILKDVALSMGVPNSVVNRPKMGFTVPIHNLLQGPFRTRFLDTLRSQKFKGQGYLNHDALSQTVGRYYGGDPSLALFCWVLFIFTQWLDRA